MEVNSMYLKKLYRHNKFLFIIIVLFAIAQLINNIRQDIAISPVYSYGMYSEQIKPLPFYTVPEIFINGKQLQAKDFSPQQWDNITLPVTEFYAQQHWNLFQWQQDIHRLLPFTDSSKFVNHVTERGFKQWYHQHMQSSLHRHVDSVNIIFSKYHFTDTSFIRTNQF
jgi:hypothetical protein